MKQDIYWDELDFFLNKTLWIHRGHHKSVDIRKQNLSDLYKVFNDEKIVFFLEGRTLEHVFYTSKLLLKDHDDDIGIFENYEQKVIDIIIPRLIQLGFRKIRHNKDMISVLRDDRYIDICIYRKSENNEVGYANKLFNKKYYSNLNKLEFEGKTFLIPSDTHDYLQKRYATPKMKMKNTIYLTLRIIKNILRDIRDYINKKRNKVVVLSEEEFLNLYIDSPNAINWKLRKKHLDIVTNNGSNKKIRNIVDYLKQPGILDKLSSEVEDTNMTTPFKNEINLDRRFWNTGNNFFFYCVKYQYLKNVVPYDKSNDYIKTLQTPMLYSKEYFESLDSMSDEEIINFFKTSKIEITKGAVTSGRHRTFAMIGRLINNKSYIPFQADKIY